jgi:hypothetical protein
MRSPTLVFSTVVLTAAVSMSAQTTFRTPWGDPDLQGVWPSGHMIEVPFERPTSFGARAVLTDAEFAARAAAIRKQAEADAAETASTGGRGVSPPSHWLERGQPSRQASLIADPPDGRLPPMTEDGARRARAWPSGNPAGGFASAADFNVYDRCITRGVLGSAFPNIYSSGTEILQSPGYVIIRHEMVHETRIVPLDGRPHLPDAIRSYMGDPRGRWEGETLVVETTNFNGKTGSYARNGNGNPTSEALRLVERFTRLEADTLQYEVTVEDPRTWTRPWTVAFPLTRDPDYVLHEYACHEGNYAIVNMLRASRAAEREPRD